MLASRLLSCAFLLLGACAGEADPEASESAEGERIYREPIEDGNTFACATCHALEEPAPDFRRPGHSLGDAAARPSFKNGAVSELREAVNSCLTEWMNAEPWTARDPRWIELERFLRSQAPASTVALDIQIVAPPGDLSGGDAARGRALFDASCAVCHDEGGTGSQLAPPVAGLALDPSYIATRVRTSGRSDSAVYDGLTGGVMPFWGADRLTDDELRDIVAWLSMDDGVADGGDEEPTSEGSGTEGGDADVDSGGDPTSDGGTDTGDELPNNCPATHERVGWIAELSTEFHDVSGVAEIVDDCTVVIHDFTYDGSGIDVRIYGGIGGDYDNGYAMTDDLLKPGGYDGVLLEAVLPEGRTLEELDGISVWCVDVGVDFGSGSFTPP
jgi:mono/diheme cytochrome c family protein